MITKSRICFNIPQHYQIYIAHIQVRTYMYITTNSRFSNHSFLQLSFISFFQMYKLFYIVGIGFKWKSRVLCTFPDTMEMIAVKYYINRFFIYVYNIVYVVQNVFLSFYGISQLMQSYICKNA